MPTPVNPDLMARAIQLSRQGYPAPNPHVGCVIELNGEIVGEGYHDHAGGPHAEIVALTQAGPKAKGGTVYTTQEPCNSQGRTGPCSEALIVAGVTRVVSAVPDPNPKMSGGNQRLREAGIEVIEGVLEAEAATANIKWLTAMRRRSPYIVGKAAISLDGRTALSTGESKWITGEESRRQAHVLRAECGAVLVGTTTVEKDDPELTVRHIEVVNQPLRIVLDRDRRLSGYKVFNDQAPHLKIVQTLESPNELEVMVEEDRFIDSEIANKLFNRGVTSLLVEGGSVTLSRFLQSRMIDRLELFVAPKILGHGPTWINGSFGPLAQIPDWTFEAPKQLGQDLWITAYPPSEK